MSCLTALELGENITTQHGGIIFIGYVDEADAIFGPYMQTCIDCDNFGLKRFIEGETLANSFKMMKDNFTTAIDNLEANGEILLAASLRKNRDVLKMFGAPHLTINDFYLNA